MLIFRKILLTYQMDGPLVCASNFKIISCSIKRTYKNSSTPDSVSDCDSKFLLISANWLEKLNPFQAKCPHFIAPEITVKPKVSGDCRDIK